MIYLLKGIDLRYGQKTLTLPVYGIGSEENVWNLSVSGPLLSLCTLDRNYSSTDGHPKVM